MSSDELYMQRCLELAQNAFGHVAPNPLVGAVIIHNDKIIGEGYHQEYGKSHAEVNAINNVADKSLLKKATLYVNLEPCAHYGKTPPCADLITHHQIPNVIIGCIDSFSEVAGKGVEKLVKSGCNVKVGVLEKESLELNKRFFTFHNKKRPYIILKWAQTTDGFIDRIRENTELPEAITSERANQLSHLWRTQESAIMVGTNTALKDNPSLTSRNIKGKNPIRVVIDKTLRIPSNYHLLDNSTTTLVLNTIKENEEGNIKYVKTELNANNPTDILNALYAQNIQSVIIEGGSQLLNGFIKDNLWDECRVFIAPKTLYSGIVAPSIPKGTATIENIGIDQLITITKQ